MCQLTLARYQPLRDWSADRDNRHGRLHPKIELEASFEQIRGGQTNPAIAGIAGKAVLLL